MRSKAQELQCFTHDRMFDVLYAIDDLRAGVTDSNALFEAGIDSDVYVFVYGSADEITTVIAIVRGQVRPATAKWYAERCSSDNQGKAPLAKRCRNSIRPAGEPIS
jgi:hypothetical protein